MPIGKSLVEMSDQLLASELWEEHEKTPFPPGLRGEGIFGVDLVLLDADTAGLVEDFLRAGRLSSKQRLVDEAIARDLEIA